MSNHKNLVFFNKEGDYLNFNYSDQNDRFEGDILFHENSSDTYKTYGVYMMENIPSFEFELPGELTTRKFQLFNEYGLHLYGAKYKDQQIVSIEPTNNDSNFYSKWIYGDNFDVKFPVGTLVEFNETLLEFNDLNRTYVVVSSKKDAIMIISQMDNDTFETTYYVDYTDSSTYLNKTISGVNAVGVYNYIDGSYNDNLSEWNEPDFYDKYYIGKKLNIVNSQLNDGILTVNDVDLTDQPHFEYIVNQSSLPTNSDLIIEVVTRTSVPRVYQGGLTIGSDGIIDISDVFAYPQILKSGVEFKIVGSINNTNFLTVANIPDWNGIVNETYFATQSQVIFNNKIYQCVQGYTQSFGSQSTAFINPTDTNYWSNPTYIKVDQSTVSESILFAQIYLTTDKYYFSYGWTASSEVTMASAADKYKEDLKLFNIDLYYNDTTNILNADLMYPSKYAVVNFYHTQVGSTYSIGSFDQKVERLVGVEETINYELNYDLSQNFKYTIVFTDLDEYGLKIIINGMVYDEEIAWVYTGSIVDVERTIDRTLRNWLIRNYLRLYSLGIRAELQYIGNYSSLFYNSIILRTEYPNVPIEINDILVGTTADYYIEHSRVLFDTGSYSIPYINITINDDLYSIAASYYPSTNITDIPTTLQNWVDEHAETLSLYDIVVDNISYLLKFDIKDPNRRLDYTINTGHLNIPGLYDYQITNKILGNHGMLIASNEVILPSTSTASFEESGFATGMVFSINNTFYPWVNQDFNIQFLDPQILNLSYQGPFWGLTDSLCNNSPFITLAFDLGFGQTACSGTAGVTGSNGPFGPIDISTGLLLPYDTGAFAVSYNPNTYTVNNYDLNTLPGTTGLVDIDYVQLSNSMYAFGDNLIVFDSYFGNYMTTVLLPGNTQSIEMEFNASNNYLYLLSRNLINIVDPLSNLLVATISMTWSAYDMEINPNNGDVYVSYSDVPQVHIWYSANLTSTPDVVITTPSLFDTMTGMMVFNDFEGDMYVTTDDDNVIRIDGSTRTILSSYGIPGLTHSIFYEPVNEAIYVYGSSSLWKIDNGVTQSISLTPQPFNDMIFNNITGHMSISDSSNNFSRLDLSTNTYLQSGLGNYGYLAINQFDTDVYLTSQSSPIILVVKPSNGIVIYTAPLSAQATRLVYNPERKSIWAIQPSINSVVEVEVQVNTSISLLPPTYDTYEENQYGTLDPNYEPRPSIWLKTRDYIRKPRENFEGDIRVQYYWKWLSDNVPQFFMYDFSGDQLDRTTTGVYTYTGPRPLTEIVLNKQPNKDINKISYPQYQQTIFDTVEYDLPYIDDENDISSDVEPLQLFLGFKSEEEGALRSVLQLFKKEFILFDINSDQYTTITMKTVENTVQGVTDRYGLIEINENSSEVFTGNGLKPGQTIAIYLKDISNTKRQYISDNNASLFRIREVYTKRITLDFINPSDFLIDESTVISDYPKVGDTTYLRFSLKTIDREIGRFTVYGQTEEEDERFKIELGNVGKLISPSDIFIFKEYDILEGGVDWKYLNMKRKEMLMMKHLIYPYIGAYKSIINAINYFGYNDLQLNEYYRNIDSTSKDFLKLFKVEIPDIFDNTVEGWTENDFIKNTYPNDNFEGTNMFNLTYFITDKDGDNVLNYSVDEIVIKLQGLKYWLKKNIIPLTHKILDITGKVYFNNGTYIKHKLHDTRIFNIRQNMTPITFKLNEAYLMPVNSGSTVYNCVIDFYSIIPNVGAEVPINSLSQVDNFDYIEDSGKPKAYNGVDLILPDYFDVKIRTYKTYKEWAPFTTYNIGDKVTYYGKLYESVIGNNKAKNPRRFENVQPWSSIIEYKVASVVEYNRDYYVSSTQSVQSSTPPNLDISNWLKVTEWKLIDYEPVQTINENRRGDDLLPFNFTIDSNLDPFVVIEVTSDNGYGCIYRDKKNYEIRGTKDLVDEYRGIDPLGPFEPIQPVY